MSRWFPASLRRRPAPPITKSPRALLEVATLEDRLAPAAFTAGNLLIYRVGDGVLTYGSAGTATPGNVTGNTGAQAFLDEYTTAGVLVQSVPVPKVTTGSQLRLVNSIGATTEGLLSLSGDGQYVSFGGYDQPISQAANVTSSTNARVLGWAKYDGTVDTSTSIAAFSGAAIRSVATNDGNQFWATGANSGLRYISTLGSTGTAGVQVDTTALVNLRGAYIFGGRLYWGTGSAAGNGSTGIYTSSATALPTTSPGSTLDTPVVTTGTSSPYQFTYLDMDKNGAINTGDRLYVADDGSAQKSILRFTYDSTGSTWGIGVQIASATSNLRGVTGRVVDATTAELFATTATVTIGASSSSSTSLLTLSDDGTATSSSTWNVVTSKNVASSTASAVIQFRGITFVPTAPTGTTTTTTVTSVSPTAVNLGQNVTFTASVTATSGTTTPTGTVEFKDGSVSFGSVTVTGTGATGTATLNATPPAGTFSNIKAIYTPQNSAFVTSTSAAFGGTLTVNANSTTTTLSSNQANPAVGTPVTFTATIATTGTPTGTVDFYANGLKVASNVALTGNTASFTMDTNAIQVVANDKLTPGINHIEARFIGTGLYLNSASDFAQKVKANAFAANAVLVLRANDGYNNPSVNGNRTYIDEFVAGTVGQTDPVQSLILPTLADGLNKPVLTSGQQSTDTQFTLSPDGLYAYFTAYQATPSNTLPLHTSSATAVPRVIGRLTLADGTIETSMALTDVSSGGVFRSLAVTAGGAIYAGGSVGGVRYIPGGYNAATTTSTDLGISGTPFTNLTIAGSTPQLYAATPNNAAGTLPKIASIGTGLPTTSTPTITTLLQPGDLLAGATPKNPESVFFADLDATASFAGGVDTMYISEFGTTGLFSGGSITKWTWKDPGTGNQWVLTDTIAANTAGQTNVDNNFTYLFGRQTGTTVNLAFSNGGGGNTASGGAVWTVADSKGYDQGFTTTTPDLLYTTSNTSGKSFRSVVQLPATAAPPTVSGFTVNGGDAQRSRITTITLNFSGTVAATNFNGAGAITLTRTAVSNPATGVVGDIVQTGPAAANHITVTQGSSTSLVLTFDNNGAFNTESTGVENGSLSDGYWQLTAGTFQSTLNDLTLRRLFGDSTSTANGTVDGSDFLDFGNFFNSNDSRYDFNNDNTISGADLLIFGNRFGRSL